MKYIKKYNESDNNEIDLDYIKMCFIDFEDSGIMDIQQIEDRICIIIELPENYSDITNGIEGSYSDCLEFLNYKVEMVMSIKTCLDKVKIEYDNLRHYIYFGTSDNNNNIDICGVTLTTHLSKYYHEI